MSEAVDSVIVDHTDCLHKGVADGGADKFETSFFQLPAHCVRLGGSGWNFFQIFPGVPDGIGADK